MADWADELAEELMLDAVRYKHADSRDLIAAKLRLLHKRGEDSGVRAVAADLGVALPSDQELHAAMKETQKCSKHS
jgi:hypothetical protein